MDIALTIRVGNQEFTRVEKAMDRVLDDVEDGLDRAARPVSWELRDFLQRVATLMRQKHGTAWSPGRQNNPYLMARSGEGIRSIVDSVKVTGTFRMETITGSISAGKLSFHEKGGTIRATRSKYLTIPLPDALNANGTPKKRSAREWTNTFVQRSRAGNLIIFQRQGYRLVPLYVLKSSVTIRPRLGLEETLHGQLPYFQQRLVDAIAKEFA